MDLQDAQAKLRAAVLISLGAIALGLLFPTVAIVLYFAVAMFLVVPFHAVIAAVLNRPRKSDGSP